MIFAVFFGERGDVGVGHDMAFGIGDEPAGLLQHAGRIVVVQRVPGIEDDDVHVGLRNTLGERPQAFHVRLALGEIGIAEADRLRRRGHPSRGQNRGRHGQTDGLADPVR